ncbi:MAG: glycosyltransferase family 39 protein [Bacteroidia bacterium]|nr:glycosyltransferase family 39 protein [Bacteroidia bacterium]
MPKWLWGYGLVLLIAIGLRLSSSVQRPLWFDEATEFWVAKTPTAELLPRIKLSLQDPPLYSMILHLWVHLGESELFLRIPSVIFSLAGIMALMYWGVREIGWRWGWLPAWGAAFAESDIRFAQEVGQYALVVAFIAWSLFFLNEFYQTGTRRSLIAWMVCSILALYTHYGSGVALPLTTGVILFYLSIQRKFRQALHLISAGAVVMLAALPLLLFWLPVQLFQGPTEGAFRVRSMTFFCESLKNFPLLFKDYILYQFMAHTYGGWNCGKIGSWIVWLPVLLLIGWGIYRSRFSWIFSAWIGGILIYYGISLFKLYPFGGHYSLVFAPHFWIGMGTSIALLMQGKIGHKILGLVAIVALPLANIKFPGEPPEDLRSVAKLWLQLRGEKDTTYVYYGAVHNLQYQLARLAPQLYSTDGLIPNWYDSCWMGKSIPACRPTGLVYGKWIRNMTPEQKRQEILGAVGYPRKFWLIASHIMWREMSQIYQQLSRDYNFTQSFVSHDAALFLLERKTIPTSAGP